MTAQILDGRAIARKLRNDIAADVARWGGQGFRLPGLAVILVGNDPASEIYVRGKRKDCDEVGFHSIVQHLSENVTQEDLEARVLDLNEDSSIDGVLVQTPLPEVPHGPGFSVGGSVAGAVGGGSAWRPRCPLGTRSAVERAGEAGLES